MPEPHLTNTLVGFAVLKANYNERASSYMDNFQDFALDVLATGGETSTMLPHDIADGVRQFGLTIPDLGRV